MLRRWILSRRDGFQVKGREGKESWWQEFD